MSKHDRDPNYVVGVSVGNSVPTYTGSGSNRTGSTTVFLTFALLGGDTVIRTETFSNIRVTTSQDFIYAIGNYDVTVTVTVTAEGTNNNMIITGATAEIIDKAANQ